MSSKLSVPDSTIVGGELSVKSLTTVGVKFSTSSFIILPLSPDPLIKFKSILFSFAIFLANGEAKTLKFSLFDIGSLTDSVIVSEVSVIISVGLSSISTLSFAIGLIPKLSIAVL